MAITREDLIPSLIPNTTMQKIFRDGVHRQYSVSPLEGYVLHDNRVDEEVINEETLEPTGEVIYRYAAGSVTVRYDYDFTLIVPDTITDINGNTIAVNKVGAYEMFAVPSNLIPENQTYGTQIFLAENDKPENWHEITEEDMK